MAWKPESWLKRFSQGADDRLSFDYEALIKELATKSEPGQEGKRPRIGRGAVSELANSDELRTGDGTALEAAVVKAFIASMIWGYGMVGYGPYRTERVLTCGGTVQDTKVIAQLAEVAETALRDGGIAAFDHIATRRRADRSYLKYLGPAFGTKFIYFLTKKPSHRTTPVMDSVVTGWLQRNAADAGTFSLSWWDTESYKRYVDVLEGWAAELWPGDGQSPRTDDVELLIFEDARGKSPLRPESENVTAESMLDDLGAEADARGGEKDTVGVLLVEALREWFALNPSTEA